MIGCCVIFLLVWLSFDLDIFIGGEKARKKAGAYAEFLRGMTAGGFGGCVGMREMEPMS